MSSTPYSDAQQEQELLKQLQDLIHDSYISEYDERKYYSYFTRIICDTSLDDSILARLNELQRPAIEFNQLQMYVNQQLGEFAKNEPGFSVSPDALLPHYTENMQQTCKVIEDHLRHKFSDTTPQSTNYHIFGDILRGGMSVARIYTDYSNKNTFKQEIKWEKVPFVTMCGFDPKALKSHKGDGDYCFEFSFYSKNEMIHMFGEDSIKDISPDASIGYDTMGFVWCFNDSKHNPIYSVCKLYKKKRKYFNLLLLEDGTEIKEKDYNKLLKEADESDDIIIIPDIKARRKTYKEKIICYTINKNKILMEEETDYDYLPLVKFLGNQVSLGEDTQSQKKIVGRSFVHNLEGAQRLMNVAGQQTAYEVENSIAHKFVMDIDSVDLTQTSQLINVQHANVVLYKSRREGDEQSQLAPPQVLARPPVPSIIENSFLQSPQIMNSLLGGLDQLGMQRTNVSGEAMDTGAIQTSMGASPWIMGFFEGLSHVLKIYSSLIPKIYNTPRSVPVMSSDGKKSYVVINDDKSDYPFYMNYDPENFNIEVTPGVNNEVAKRISVNQLITLAQMGGQMAEFVTTKCLPELFSNLDVRNQDSFMKKANEFIQEKEEQRKMQMEMMAKNPPIDPVKANLQLKTQELQQEMAIKGKELEQKQQQMMIDARFRAAELQRSDAELQLDAMKVNASIENSKAETFASIQKSDSENLRSNVNLAIEIAKHGEDIKRDRLDRIQDHLKSQKKMNEYNKNTMYSDDDDDENYY